MKNTGSALAVRSILLILALTAAVCGLLGCNRRPEPGAASESVDLAARFVLAHPRLPQHFQRMEVVRKGSRKAALVLVAPAIIRASLDGISGGKSLEFSAAPVFDIGDGIQMGIFLRRGEMRIPLASRSIDPGRRYEDRDWIPIAIPLQVGPEDQLEIEAAAGPQGNLTGDWLAIGSIRLVP